MNANMLVFKLKFYAQLSNDTYRSKFIMASLKLFKFTNFHNCLMFLSAVHLFMNAHFYSYIHMYIYLCILCFNA